MEGSLRDLVTVQELDHRCYNALVVLVGLNPEIRVQWITFGFILEILFKGRFSH